MADLSLSIKTNLIASSPRHSKIYLAAEEKSWEKAWDQNYVTDWKWWTQLVRNVD